MPKNTANKIQINLLLRKNTEPKILERKKNIVACGINTRQNHE